MKNVLLTTTALVAFAGAAAAADVSVDYSGDAWVEYDFDTADFHADLNAAIDVTFTQELNNGMVASLSLPAAWELSDDSTDNDFDSTDFDSNDIDWVAMLETSYGSLSFGSIDNVTDGAFAETAGMAVDVDGGGSDDDEDITFGDWNHDIRAETTLGGFALAASTDDDGEYMSFSATGSTGAVDFGIYYEANDANDDVMGVTASTSFGGFDVDVAYASTDDSETSVGVAIAYAVSDAISVSASHAVNSEEADESAVGVAYASGAITASLDYDVDAGTYEVEAGWSDEIAAGTTVTLGTTFDGTDFGASVDVEHAAGDMTVYAGANTDSEFYAGVNYDLGGGADAYAYYADGTDMGPLEWSTGTIAGVSFEF